VEGDRVERVTTLFPQKVLIFGIGEIRTLLKRGRTLCGSTTSAPVID
jgi:hypothetical protein